MFEKQAAKKKHYIYIFSGLRPAEECEWVVVMLLFSILVTKYPARLYSKVGKTTSRPNTSHMNEWTNEWVSSFILVN